MESVAQVRRIIVQILLKFFLTIFPIILLKYGYTEKHSNEIYHNHLIKDFVGIEKIITQYL